MAKAFKKPAKKPGKNGNPVPVPAGLVSRLYTAALADTHGSHGSDAKSKPATQVVGRNSSLTGGDSIFYLPGQLSPGQQGGASIMGPMPPPLDAEQGAKPSLVEYGSTGVAILAGVIQSEEYNPDLQWKQWIHVAEKMRRAEPTINQTLMIMEHPLRSATWKIAPASPDPRHLEHASFIETCLFHSLEGQTWDDVLRQIISIMLSFGFAPFEKVFKIEDGFVKWQKLATRLPRTIHRWWEGPNKELVGMQQWTWNPTTQQYEYINIPADRVLLFVNRQEGGNYEGLAVLRPAYKPFWYKQAYEKLQAVGFEREHVGIPVISLPEGYSDADAGRAKQIGRNARSNEVGYIVLPPGWGVEWLKSRSPEKKSTGIQDAIRYCDLQMQNNVLAGFLNLGQSGTGSYAMSSDQSTLFLKSLQAIAKYIASVFNMDAFPQLLKFNYGPLDMYPRLVPQNIQAYNIKDIADAIHNLVLSGAMRPTIEIEDFLYDVIGIPRPPANLVESTNVSQGQKVERLHPDLTGLTPLPLTPEEQIAIANRMTRDIQKVTAEGGAGNGVGSPSDQNAKPDDGQAKVVGIGNLPSHISGRGSANSTSARGTPSAASPDTLRELPEVYRHYALSEARFMSPAQSQAYARMAQEAGRPTITLTGDYMFASHPLVAQQLAEQPRLNPVQEARLQRRRELTGGLTNEIRQNLQSLRQELMQAVQDESRRLEEQIPAMPEEDAA